MLYAYAITESQEPPRIGGLERAPLRSIGDEHAGLFAIVSEHAKRPLAADPEDLWVHEVVVETAMDRGAVLPMRVGSSFIDGSELLEALRSHRHELLRSLQRVDGAVEVGVRAVLDANGTKSADPEVSRQAATGRGTAYMLSRLEQQSSSERLATAIHAPLATLAREATWQVQSGEPPRLVAAYLVDRARIESFAAHVTELERESGIAIVCTGPWPPYSFVTGGDA